MSHFLNSVGHYPISGPLADGLEGGVVEEWRNRLEGRGVGWRLEEWRNIGHSGGV